MEDKNLAPTLIRCDPYISLFACLGLSFPKITWMAMNLQVPSGPEILQECSIKVT